MYADSSGLFFVSFQMAPKVVRDTVLTLVREGFLQQVMGPALLQVCHACVCTFVYMYIDMHSCLCC